MEQNQKRFLAAFAALLAKMSKADGIVTDDERELVAGAWRRMGLTQEQCDYCKAIFDIAEKDSVPLSRCVAEFVNSQFALYTRAFIYDLLWEVACVDGVLHPGEKKMLGDLPQMLGLPGEAFDVCYARCMGNRKLVRDIDLEDRRKAAEEKKRRRAEEEARRKAEEDARRRKAEEDAKRKAEEERRKREEEAKRKQKEAEEARRREEEEAYRRASRRSPFEHLRMAFAMLGCSPSATNEELKRAYRNAAMKYHPDKLRMDGVPEELVKRANERMAIINDAWDTIRRARGIR